MQNYAKERADSYWHAGMELKQKEKKPKEEEEEQQEQQQQGGIETFVRKDETLQLSVLDLVSEPGIKSLTSEGDTGQGVGVRQAVCSLENTTQHG